MQQNLKSQAKSTKITYLDHAKSKSQKQFTNISNYIPLVKFKSLTYFNSRTKKLITKFPRPTPNKISLYVSKSVSLHCPLCQILTQNVKNEQLRTLQIYLKCTKINSFNNLHFVFIPKILHKISNLIK